MNRIAWILAVFSLVGCVGEEKDSATIPCADATPLLDAAGASTGFERCADGTIHRVTAVATDTAITDETCPYTAADSGTHEIYCTTDADCTDQAYGHCVHASFGEGPDGCACTYTCATDADCAEGTACVPDGLVAGVLTHASCVQAGCRTDADCTSGECGMSWFDNGCGYTVVLACRAVTDACRVDADCPSSESCVP